MKQAQLDQKIKTAIADAEAEAKAAKDDLAAHKTDGVKWLADLASLNEDMDRKLAKSSFCSFSYPTHNFVFPPN